MSRQKSANYFSHDSNARNDEKLVRLRMKHGAAGYGVYFMILERLREDADYMSARDYNMLAFDLRVDAALIKSVVEDFGLFVFTEERKYFYSDSFNRRMGAMGAAGKVRSEAASKAAQYRWKKELAIPEVLGDTITKETTTEKVVPPNEGVNEKYLEKFFKTSNEKIEILLMSLGLSPGDKDTLRKVAEEVINEWKITEAFHTGYQDWTSHLISTIRIKLQKNKPTAAGKKEEQAKKAREEYEREQAEQSRKRDEMYRTSVSYDEAKKTEEYRRALEGK